MERKRYTEEQIIGFLKALHNARCRGRPVFARFLLSLVEILIFDAYGIKAPLPTPISFRVMSSAETGCSELG
ncbi:MAG: hypothetical protein OXC05_12875 [Halieaceae bacterium]|nr:hypothetical protein [Halieaceae bacterium]